MEQTFKDGLKVDDSKKHLIFRPAYARIDARQGLVKFWDYGPNYASFDEMASQRKEINPERIAAGLNSLPGLQFANRGVCVAMVLEYQGDEYLVASCKRDSKALVTINGYFANGTNAELEHKCDVPENIGVADSIIRTAVIEVLEEVNIVKNNKISKGDIQIVKDSLAVSFAPFKAILPYSDDIQYRVIPLKRRLECLTNLHAFPVAKAESAEDKNPVLMGDNIGIYFDGFHNCYQIVACVKTRVEDIDFLFQTEDKYRDKVGMDTFLYRDGIKLIKLDDRRKMVGEVYQIKTNGKLDRIPIEDLVVLDPFIPKDPKTGTIIASSLSFKEALEY